MRIWPKSSNMFFTILILGQSAVSSPGFAGKEVSLREKVKPSAGSIIMNILPSVESETMGEIDKTRMMLERIEKAA